MPDTQQLFIATVRTAGEPGERKYAVRAATPNGALEALLVELGHEVFNRSAVAIEWANSDPLNAGVAAQMQRAIEIEAQNVLGFCIWLANNAMHLEPTVNPTMGGQAGEAFFLGLSVPTLVAALMGNNVRGATLESARDVLLRRYLEDDETQARCSSAWAKPRPRLRGRDHEADRPAPRDAVAG